MHSEPPSDLALRDGLRRLPDPTSSPAPEFDARVLDALRRPRPWWRTMLRETRPLLAGAFCSCAVMLAALSWSLQTPPGPHPATPPALSHPAPSLDMAALDHLLDRPGLSAASLASMTPPGPSAASDAPRRLPVRPRRVSQRSPIMV